ncbi:MAG TPA: FHA domain-containing protein [Actinomycetota bacterium]|nr:FHA domain-containing protein [Actinomycetota bacterium]
MPEAVLDILKYFFLFLIFLFLARAVKAMILEISGPRAQRGLAPPPVAGSAAPAAPRPAGRAPEKMAVTAPGSKPRMFDITDELIIGRADKCHVVISDSYASQIHARVFRRQDAVYIEDMGSTNGTYLNRKKVTAPIQVNRGDTARIGKTEMEFRR